MTPPPSCANIWSTKNPGCTAQAGWPEFVSKATIVLETDPAVPGALVTNPSPPSSRTTVPGQPLLGSSRGHVIKSDQTKVTLSAGRNVDPTHCHNVGQLFNLAASTQAASLTATGSNTVVTERISSVQDFNNGLTTNGTISGGVSYFGHGAQMPQADGSYLSVLAPGQGAGVDTNVSALNVSTLSNSQLGQNVRITLNACNAGLPPIRGGGHSIAQLIANQLNRPVLAWKVGTFFANDLTTRFPKKLNPQSNLIYMVPTGGSDIAPCTFTPNQPEPQHCGGVK
ncbi:MAG: hypothetical protein DMG88_04335 [Acidobacteria bacterium]|nr:MAG: hypothetical protein DMG88_04335 [Acidobacteriota bacterium]